MAELGGVQPKPNTANTNAPVIGGITPKENTPSGNSPSVGGVTGTTK